jgi:hypothetical protein
MGMASVRQERECPKAGFERNRGLAKLRGERALFLLLAAERIGETGTGGKIK